MNKFFIKTKNDTKERISVSDIFSSEMSNTNSPFFVGLGLEDARLICDDAIEVMHDLRVFTLQGVDDLGVIDEFSEFSVRHRMSHADMFLPVERRGHGWRFDGELRWKLTLRSQYLVFIDLCVIVMGMYWGIRHIKGVVSGIRAFLVNVRSA